MKAITLKNGEIKTFPKLPNNITIDGKFYLNISEADSIELGFGDVEYPNINPQIEELGNLHKNPSTGKYTFDVTEKKIPETLAELKAKKTKDLKTKFNVEFQRLQWYWDRANRTNYSVPVPQEIIDLDEALRIQCNELETQIDALTTKKSVILFELPTFQ